MRTTREILPSETWELINELYAYSREQSSKVITRDGRYEYLERVIGQCQQMTGLFKGIMTQGLAYQFVRMGRNLERADMTTRVIDIGANTLMNTAHQKSPYVDLLWVTLLRSLNGFQMFRQSRSRSAEAESIIDFLILNESFPRAVIHCLHEVKSCAESIKRNTTVLRTVNKTIKHTNLFDTERLDYKYLHEFLDHTQLDINTMHESISGAWFKVA